MFALIGRAEYAVTLALSIRDPKKQAAVLNKVAVVLVEAGKTDEVSNITELALSAANAITDPYEKVHALANIASRWRNLARPIKLPILLKLHSML